MHIVRYNGGSFKQIQLRGCLKYMYDLENPPCKGVIFFLANTILYVIMSL